MKVYFDYSAFIDTLNYDTNSINEKKDDILNMSSVNKLVPHISSAVKLDLSIYSIYEKTEINIDFSLFKCLKVTRLFPRLRAEKEAPSGQP